MVIVPEIPGVETKRLACRDPRIPEESSWTYSVAPRAGAKPPKGQTDFFVTYQPGTRNSAALAFPIRAVAGTGNCVYFTYSNYLQTILNPENTIECSDLTGLTPNHSAKAELSAPATSAPGCPAGTAGTSRPGGCPRSPVPAFPDSPEPTGPNPGRRRAWPSSARRPQTRSDH